MASGAFCRGIPVYGARVAGFRERSVRKAVVASFLVPLVAGSLSIAQNAGFDLPQHRWLGFVLLTMSAIPTSIFLLTAAAGRPWTRLEQEWDVLSDWQRAMSGAVALLCGLTAGAAVVLILLSLVESTAGASEQTPARPPSAAIGNP